MRGMRERIQSEHPLETSFHHSQPQSPADTVYAMSSNVCLENLSAGSHENAHWRETAQVRSVWGGLCILYGPEATHYGPQWHQTVRLHHLRSRISQAGLSKEAYG